MEGVRFEIPRRYRHFRKVAVRYARWDLSRVDLVDHAAGNYRLLMTMGGELLAYGMAHEVAQLDEKSYLEVFQPSRPRGNAKKKART